MSIRDDILDAYRSTLEGISIAGGYNIDVTTVEIAARGWDEIRTRPELRTWIGIVTQGETNEDQPGYVESDWMIDLHVHQTAGAHTAEAVKEANGKVMSDIRKALYATANLGVNGVHYTRLMSNETSTSSPQAVQDGIASVIVSTLVHFEEAIGA